MLPYHWIECDAQVLQDLFRVAGLKQKTEYICMVKKWCFKLDEIRVTQVVTNKMEHMQYSEFQFV